MPDKGFTTIQDWMLELDLDIYEVVILAVIYGFSQDGESSFGGSPDYLAKKAKCSRRKVMNALPKLVAMGIVTKEDKIIRGVKICEYKVCTSCIGCARGAQGCARGAQGCARGAHNNIVDNIEDIDKSISTLSNKGGRKFQKPSIDEIREYCLERGNSLDPEQFYNFYESKGWMVGRNPMKDWHAAIRTWEKREKEVAPRKRESPQPQPQRKESVFEHNLRVMDQMFGTNMHEKAYGTKKDDADEQ